MQAMLTAFPIYFNKPIYSRTSVANPTEAHRAADGRAPFYRAPHRGAPGTAHTHPADPGAQCGADDCPNANFDGSSPKGDAAGGGPLGR